MLLKRFFLPDDFIEKYEFIDVEYMNMHNKKVIISDLDNTLISWDSKKDTKELNRWLKKMRRAGFDIIVVFLLHSQYNKFYYPIYPPLLFFL